MIPQARHIDDAVALLDAVVDDCRARPCRMGYFAALYRRVTVEVKGRMDKGAFVDVERMDRLDTVFANRYLEAYHRHRAGLAPTRAWAYAFAATDDPGATLLQHLLLGMNAHIHLDLGVAAAAVAREHGTADFRHDFDAINAVLFDLVDGIQDEVARASGALQLADRLGGRLDERLLGYGLAQARARAWRRATALLHVPPAFHGPLIDRIDAHTERLARRIHRPPHGLDGLVRALREAEHDPVDVLIARLT